MKTPTRNWKIDPSDNFLIIDQDGLIVADTNTGTKTSEENEEEARLMAAAPELLEALEEIFALISAGTLVRNIEQDAEPGFAGRAIRLVQSLGKAQQAIAKAKGDA